jgi:cell wall assembly regulator SMI1
LATYFGASPKEGDAMTERDMQRLEAAIGRSLSPSVRQFFLNFSPELRGLERDEDFDAFKLTDDADALIEMNMPGRSHYIPHDWAPHMFILGADGSGVTYWVDLASKHGAVQCFEAGQAAEYSDEVAESLTEFAEKTGEPGDDDE